MKIFYIGSDGPLSVQPLLWLLSSKHIVCGLGMDQHQPESSIGQENIPMVHIEHNSLVMLARQHKIPIIDLCGKDSHDVVTSLRTLQPDLVLVSCYARKISDDILDTPGFGCVNCHPSLLPAYRGPVPLFWQYRNGEDPLGVSLHFMNSQWDAGDVIAAATMPVTDGHRSEQVNMDLSSLLCDLLEHTLDRFPDEITPVTRQKERASYQGYPKDEDFQVSSKWSARRIFNFMRATEHWGRPYPCDTGGRGYELKRALGYSEDAEARMFAGKPDVIRLECNPGVLVASYYH
jgi:methionyl-tRNA formyltransferase